MVPRSTRTPFIACACALLSLIPLQAQGADKQWSSSGSLPADAPVFGLAVDPAQPSTVYAATIGAGLLRTDDGKTWRVVSSTLPKRIWRVTVDASRTADGFAPIYVGSAGGGLFKSLDGGRTWKNSNTGLGSTLALNVRALALGRGQLTIGTSDGVYRSTDGGQNWQAMGLQGNDISSVAYATYGGGGNPTVVLAGVDGVKHGDSRLLLSKDGGVTWTPIKQGIPADMVVSAVAAGPVPSNADNLHPARPVFVAGSAGIYKSDDGGVTFAQQSGLPAQGFGALALSSADPNIVYVASDGTAGAAGGVWRSTDRGGTWTALGSGLSERAVTAIALGRNSPPSLLASAFNPDTPSVTVFTFTDSQAPPGASPEDGVCPEAACASGSPLPPPPLSGPVITTALVNNTLPCQAASAATPPASPGAATGASAPTPAAGAVVTPSPAARPCPTAAPPSGGGTGGFPVIPAAAVVGAVLLVLVFRAVSTRQ